MITNPATNNEPNHFCQIVKHNKELLAAVILIGGIAGALIGTLHISSLLKGIVGGGSGALILALMVWKGKKLDPSHLSYAEWSGKVGIRQPEPGRYTWNLGFIPAYIPLGVTLTKIDDRTDQYLVTLDSGLTPEDLIPEPLFHNCCS